MKSPVYQDKPIQKVILIQDKGADFTLGICSRKTHLVQGSKAKEARVCET